MSVPMIFVSDRAAQAKCWGKSLGCRLPTPFLSIFRGGCWTRFASLCTVKLGSAGVKRAFSNFCSSSAPSIRHVANFIDPGWLAWV
jgi:hypothetical protein